jgi:hypothetical protein
MGFRKTTAKRCGECPAGLASTRCALRVLVMVYAEIYDKVMKWEEKSQEKTCSVAMG